MGVLTGLSADGAFQRHRRRIVSTSSSYRRVRLLLLGAAQIIIGVALLPLLAFFGVLSMIIAPILLLWMTALGVRVQQPTKMVRAHLRRTHAVVLPLAAGSIIYGVYALVAAGRSAESGGGLLGAFGAIPIVCGVVAGGLSLVSLWWCRHMYEDDRCAGATNAAPSDRG